MAASESIAGGGGFHLPFSVRMERRLSQPKWLAPATSIGAVIVALIIGGVVIQAAGGEAWAS